MFAFHSAGATAFSQSYFDGGTGGILLDNVGCSGQEQRLVDCNHSPIGVHDCSHSEDAGVFCVPPCKLSLYTGAITNTTIVYDNSLSNVFCSSEAYSHHHTPFGNS